MPQRGALDECGPEDTDGQVHDRIQTNGRCEAAIERGDTYGPVSYLAYVPATSIFGWSGKWDSLPAAHATSIAFDVVTMLGLALVGLRFGGRRLAALLVFAWAAYPFHGVHTQREHERRDHAGVPRLRLLACLVSVGERSGGRARRLDEVRCAPRRGPLGDLPEYRRSESSSASSPRSRERRWSRSVSSCSSPTSGRRLGRSGIVRSASRSDATPRSRSGGGGGPHAEGIPDLGFVQPVLVVLAAALALVVAVLPRRKGPVELAALTAAVLVAFQLTLTHWFYLYLPWVLPFVLLWLLLPRLPEDQGNGYRSASIDEALPVSASQSTSAPSIRTSP